MMRERATPGRWRAWLLLLFLILPLGAGSAFAQSTTPGERADRAFGPLSISYVVDAVYARVTVSLSLAAEPVGEAVLTPDKPTYRFDLSAEGDQAQGTLTAAFEAAPGISALNGDFQTGTSGSASVPFKGAVVTWTAGDDLIYVEQTFDLSPEISARTQVRGSARSVARVILLAGSLIMGEVNMIQASPKAVIGHDLILGDAKIYSGAAFTLTIPTALQRGQVFMEGAFQSGSIPQTTISSAIANWSLQGPSEAAR